MNSNREPLVESTADFEDIISVFKSIKLDSIADRLVQLNKLISDDPAEKPIDLKSLQKFALFVIHHLQLTFRPALSVSSDGFVHAEWSTDKKDIMVMIFLPSGLIKFVVVFGQSTNNCHDWNMRGTLPPVMVMKVINPFLDTFMKQD